MQWRRPEYVGKERHVCTVRNPSDNPLFSHHFSSMIDKIYRKSPYLEDFQSPLVSQHRSFHRSGRCCQQPTMCSPGPPSHEKGVQTSIQPILCWRIVREGCTEFTCISVCSTIVCGKVLDKSDCGVSCRCELFSTSRNTIISLFPSCAGYDRKLPVIKLN